MRLGSIATVLGGKRIPAGRKLSVEKTAHVYIRVSDMKENTVSMENLQYVPDDIYFYATEHAVCVDTFANTSVSWACLFLKALNLNQYATATAQPGLAVSNIVEVYIPLPPLPEQKRIVEKIEELMPIINSISK